MKAERVIWVEGTLLSQQHFQQRDRYYDEMLTQQIRFIAPWHWGLIKLVIDEAALGHKQFRILECALVFPNGQSIDYCTARDEPLMCDLETASQDITAVYLTLAANTAVFGIQGYQSLQKVTAWSAHYQDVADLYDAERVHEVLFAKPHLVLRTDSTQIDPYCSLKIAELRHMHLTRDEDSNSYIAPCLQLKNSKSLLHKLNRFIHLLQTKIQNIREKQNHSKLKAVSYEYNHYLLLSLLKELLASYIVLQHFYQLADKHPQALYLEIIRLLGKLSAFSEHSGLNLDIEYKHDDLRDTFTRAENLLIKLLDMIIPQAVNVIPLEKIRDSLYHSDNLQKLLRVRAKLFLAIHFESAQQDWEKQLVHTIKIAACDEIDAVVSSALSGIKIKTCERIPDKLPTQAGCEYFSLLPGGIFWQQLEREGKMAIFMPEFFAKAKVELLAIPGH